MAIRLKLKNVAQYQANSRNERPRAAGATRRLVLHIRKVARIGGVEAGLGSIGSQSVVGHSHGL